MRWTRSTIAAAAIALSIVLFFAVNIVSDTWFSAVRLDLTQPMMAAVCCAGSMIWPMVSKPPRMAPNSGWPAIVNVQCDCSWVRFSTAAMFSSSLRTMMDAEIFTLATNYFLLQFKACAD